MAIEPTVALRYKPIEVENPLTRVANYQNILANKIKIDEAQRAQEEQNQLRAMVEGGADINSPEFLQQAFAKSPTLGMQVGKYQAENVAARTKNLTDRMKVSKDNLSNVTTPEEYLAWSKANHDDPILGPELARMGASHDNAVAKVQEAMKTPGGFQNLLLQSQGGIEKALDYKLKVQQFNAEERHRRATEGAAWANVDLARQRLAKEGDAGSFTPETLDMAANYVRNGGNIGDLVGGMGRNALDAKMKVLNRVSELDKGKGLTPEQSAAQMAQRRQDLKTQQRVMQDMGTGKLGTTVRAFNAATDHLEQLEVLSRNLKNSDLQGVNAVGQNIAAWTGGTAPTNFDAAKNIVSTEIVKAVTGAGGGVEDRKRAADILDRAKTPAQLEQAIRTIRGLAGGQLKAAEQQYQSSTGRTDFREKYLTPSARRSMGEGQPAPTAKPGTAPPAKPGAAMVKRTGTLNGRKVIEYTDGRVEYAD